MTAPTMTKHEFARTTYDPILTQKLSQVVNMHGLAEELAPRQPQTPDEIAFGFNMNEVELTADAHGTVMLTRKETVAPHLGRVSAKEMHRAAVTREFVYEQEQVEREFALFPYFSDRGPYAPYVAAYGWPRERAWYKARALSLDETSGISTDALRRVDDMYTEADALNQAHDTVTSGGAHVEVPERDRSPEGRNLRGDNWGGRGTFRIPVLKARHNVYDIQDGLAVRWSSEVDAYVPFAPQHQERAIVAMRRAAVNAMDRSDERIRADAVKKAKETLGRAGVKIPKAAA